VNFSEISHETFSTLIDILKCRHSSDINNNNQLTPGSKFDYKLTIDQCFKLVLACDRFFLTDLKEFFISMLAWKFISIGTLSSLFKLAWRLSNSYLASACVEFLLAQFQYFSAMHTGLERQQSSVDESASDKSSSENETQCLDGFREFFEMFLSELKSEDNVSPTENELDNSNNTLLNYFRKFLKIGLIEIIKNNSWKF
jgi:hypothetical protein